MLLPYLYADFARKYKFVDENETKKIVNCVSPVQTRNMGGFVVKL